MASWCHVALGGHTEWKFMVEIPDEEETYGIPDWNIITVSAVSFLCLDAVFQPSVLHATTVLSGGVPVSGALDWSRTSQSDLKNKVRCRRVTRRQQPRCGSVFLCSVSLGSLFSRIATTWMESGNSFIGRETYRTCNTFLKCILGCGATTFLGITTEMVHTVDDVSPHLPTCSVARFT